MTTTTETGTAEVRSSLLIAGQPVVGHTDGPPLRCASLLTPLYFWAASSHLRFVTDRAAWWRLAEPAIVVSADDPTVEL